MEVGGLIVLIALLGRKGGYLREERDLERDLLGSWTARGWNFRRLGAVRLVWLGPVQLRAMAGFLSVDMISGCVKRAQSTFVRGRQAGGEGFGISLSTVYWRDGYDGFDRGGTGGLLCVWVQYYIWHEYVWGAVGYIFRFF